MDIVYVPSPHPDEALAILNALTTHFEVTREDTFENALALLRRQRRSDAYCFRAAIVDDHVGDPASGIRAVRHLGISIPIIVLTRTKPIPETRVRYLEAGADECLPVRHVNAAELQASVRAVIRRSLGQASNELRVGNLLLRLDERCFYVDGQRVQLGRSAYRLLEELVFHVGKNVPYERLENIVYAHGEPPQDKRPLHSLMKRIRSQLCFMECTVRVETTYAAGFGIFPP